MKNLELLEEIVPDFPATRIMLLTDTDSPLIPWLSSLIKSREASLDIKTFSQELAKTMKNSPLSQNQLINIELIDTNTQRYDNQGYKYDTLFLHIKNKTENTTFLLERIYAGMKNAGGIICIQPKTNPLALDLETALDEANFVAVNPIDLDKNHIIYYAKKMHGWDGAR